MTIEGFKTRVNETTTKGCEKKVNYHYYIQEEGKLYNCQKFQKAMNYISIQ